jgi:tRNA A-37 threonylcarbamoyl transferase component Bud32
MAPKIKSKNLLDPKFATRLAPNNTPWIYRLNHSPNTIVKVGDNIRLSEAASMNFVRSKTSIPVPEVYDIYEDATDPQRYLLLMEYIEGDVLRDVWDTMSLEEKEEVVGQLRGYMDELRQIQGAFVGSVEGGSCNDQVFECDDEKSYGPYETEEAFNQGIVLAMRTFSGGIFTEMVCDMVKDLPKHKIVLTHGDIAPRNIIVRDGKIVAVLDWELCGFYPEYWEYVKALYMPSWETGWILERVVDRIVKPFHIEHAVMRQVRDVFM